MIILRQAITVSQKTFADPEINWNFCVWNQLTMAAQHEKVLWFSTERRESTLLALLKDRRNYEKQRIKTE